MNQNINTDSKNSKEPQQKYRLKQSLRLRPRNIRPCGRQRALATCTPGRAVCRLQGMQYVGEKVWECCLGAFDLVGCNGPCQHVGLGRLNGPTRCTPVALGFTGSERRVGSKVGPVVKNGENIASGRQSLGMRPRNLRSYGRQRALSTCMPARHYVAYYVYPFCFQL